MSVIEHALDEDDEQPLTPAASLLDELRVVFATIDADWAHWEDLVARLAELRPVYAAGRPTSSPGTSAHSASRPASSTTTAPTGAGSTAAESRPSSSCR